MAPTGPVPRDFDVLVSTGDRLLAWQGYGGGGSLGEVSNPDDGGLYDPVANRWTPMATAGAPLNWRRHGDAVLQLPAGRYLLVAQPTELWTGSALFVWGGRPHVGAQFDPKRNAWTPIARGPSTRFGFGALAAGTKVAIWGGFRTEEPAKNLAEGFFFDAATHAWTAMESANAPSGRSLPTLAWTGTSLVVFGGCLYAAGECKAVTDGGIYDPAVGSWRPIPALPPPPPRTEYRTHWTGTRLVVWLAPEPMRLGPEVGDGFVLDPATATWTPLPPLTNAPSQMEGLHRPHAFGLGHTLVAPGMGAMWREGESAWVTMATPSGGRFRWRAFADGNLGPAEVAGRLVYEVKDGVGLYDPAANAWERIESPPKGDTPPWLWVHGAIVAWGGQVVLGKPIPECQGRRPQDPGCDPTGEILRGPGRVLRAGFVYEPPRP
jgi:hypothetical protein